MKDMIQNGDLLVYLADNPLEVEAAQRLRYQVFYEEMGAVPSLTARREKIDADPFDHVCDHLLVVDKARSNGKPFVAGTYRLLRRAVAERAEGFYSRNEFDLSQLMGYPGEIVELGRSCVHADYRSGAVMQLLWRGIADYLDTHNIEMMFGCASFPGTDPDAIQKGLSYLHHYHLAPAEIRPRARDTRFVDMGKIAPDWLDRRSALSELPPLIKGYLRLGCYIGEGAVIDRQFNTIDVLIVLPVSAINSRYFAHFGQPND